MALFFVGFNCECDDSHLEGITGICDTSLCDDGETFCLNGGSCDNYDTYSRCLCPLHHAGTNCELSTTLNTQL